MKQKVDWPKLFAWVIMLGLVVLLWVGVVSAVKAVL